MKKQDKFTYIGDQVSEKYGSLEQDPEEYLTEIAENAVDLGYTDNYEKALEIAKEYHQRLYENDHPDRI